MVINFGIMLQSARERRAIRNLLEHSLTNDGSRNSLEKARSEAEAAFATQHGINFCPQLSQRVQKEIDLLIKEEVVLKSMRGALEMKDTDQYIQHFVLRPHMIHVDKLKASLAFVKVRTVFLSFCLFFGF